MDNPNEDTEWNDILRQHKILPPKKEAEISEEQLTGMLEETIREKQGGGMAIDSMGLDELDELEDEEDERVLLEYKKKRLAEMKLAQARNKFGELVEITGHEYVQQVNKAGEGVWVVLHLYKQGIPLCSLINRHLTLLAKKFQATKFLCSISTTCIPNFPDRNLPTIFVYLEENIKGQICGPMEFGGMNLTQDELEWKLSAIGALKTELDENPWKKRQIHDVMRGSILGTRREDADDDD